MTESDSWRETLYVWDGIMLVGVPDDKVKGEQSFDWRGTWVACADCSDAKMADIPKRGFGENVPSNMTFDVQGSIKTKNKDSKDGCAQIASVANGEGYDLEGEDQKKRKHKDETHDILLPNLKWTGNLKDQRVNIVYAIGSNEFGFFISVGWMRPGNRLTLGRRYIHDDDLRSKWSLDELQKAVLIEIASEKDNMIKVITPPWKCDTLHSDIMHSAKKRKTQTDP
mmetsp:Transcript_1583/g.1509  ORF Transcript_1583/g.1509 Transcript_1583/m.1509 type:complete len:225 (-) Transcript_1583:414-1088(-)|eukprot:CAMPEP_0197837992 /NCGR_PEP_ID=MMETSP1437-20131217/33961_1 /TAXON_ID=49252 ORGANISM="Eucampia antarctica, Strain CCMP1452" /NCGR_SAMPLE_ID=MMETSP1437 /ASSEMBLY_ACC=CAM_ASM_001096 /LENGTH=224 /DNA_ID=CAMNT_0043445487 /DNA_START=167 /DNA_END=841 /DNA_ORIENTATION=-